MEHVLTRDEGSVSMLLWGSQWRRHSILPDMLVLCWIVPASACKISPSPALQYQYPSEPGIPLFYRELSKRARRLFVKHCESITYIDG